MSSFAWKTAGVIDGKIRRRRRNSLQTQSRDEKHSEGSGAEWIPAGLELPLLEQSIRRTYPARTTAFARRLRRCT